MAVIAAAMFALGAVSTRRLKTLDVSVIQFHYSIISTAVTGAWLAMAFCSTEANDDKVPF